MHGNATGLDVETAENPELHRDLCSDDDGYAMQRFVDELHPICRSITGDGIRRTLALIRDCIPITRCQVPSGLQVFDRVVPDEWNIRDAYIQNSVGERIVDFRSSQRHVLVGSRPVRQRMSLADLKPHLFSDRDRPDLIPYRTTFDEASWGFCLPHSQLLSLPDGDYDVCIDSTLAPGHLSYGQLRLIGRTSEEFLIACDIGRPAPCNDSLSGIAVVTALAQRLSSLELRYSYRLLFVPGAIGAITWLSLNEAHLGRIRHGFVIGNVGDVGHVTYTSSRTEDAEIDRAWAYVLKQDGAPYHLRSFERSGYDEWPYGAPGVDLPVGCVTRSSPDPCNEGRAWADDSSSVSPASLGDALAKALTTIDVIDNNAYYVGLKPFDEPGPDSGGSQEMSGITAALDEQTRMSILDRSDGQHSLLDIASRANLPWQAVTHAAHALHEAGLLKRADPQR